MGALFWPFPDSTLITPTHFHMHKSGSDCTKFLPQVLFLLLFESMYCARHRTLPRELIQGGDRCFVGKWTRTGNESDLVMEREKPS